MNRLMVSSVVLIGWWMKGLDRFIVWLFMVVGCGLCLWFL